MILKNLTLKNFRKFKDTTIEFPDGVTGIIGLNGSGKSTIFEAIAWALYGSVAARTSVEQIRRENTDSSESCRVELEFIFEENNYRIVREMTGKTLSTSATATVNGKQVVNGARPLTEYIEKKLGMDFKSFFTSIFAKQKELNALSSMNASERRPLILRMLGIDSLDKVIKEIKSDKRNKDSLVEKLKNDLVDEEGNDKIKKYQEKIKTLKEKKEKSEKQIKKAKEKISNLKKETDKTKNQYQKQKEQYEKTNKKKEKLDDKKTLFEKKEKLQKEIKKLNKKINKRKENIKKQKKKTEDYKETEKNLEKTEKRIKELSETKESVIKKIEQKKTSVTNLEKDIEKINKKQTKIENLGPNAQCPTCGRELKDHYNKLLNKFENKAHKKEKEKKSFTKQIEEKEKEKEKVSRENKALQKKKNFLQNKLKEKERISTTIENLSKELDSEEKELKEKKEKLEEIKDVEFNKDKYEKVKKQVKEFYEKYQKILEILNQKKDKLGDAKLDLEKKQGNKKLVSQRINNLKDKIKELKKAKKRIKKEKKDVEKLEMLTDIMSSFRTHLISRIRPTLSSYASDFFERLTDGKYQQVELDEKYNLKIYDEGELYDIERFSGGEEDLANLCLRLAISEVITERAEGVFNFIILDEIFGSQDMIRRNNIMRALGSLSSKFRQIFLITHIEDLKNDMENVLYVNENEDGTSTVRLE